MKPKKPDNRLRYIFSHGQTAFHLFDREKRDSISMNNKIWV